MRPVAKIGVIAPFEGLYRETGYAVLDAVRRGIEDCSPSHAAVLPLALDDSSQPDSARRAARKLLADPSVVAVVGPFALETISALAPGMSGASPLWIVPTAVDSAGTFAHVEQELDWLTGFVLDVEEMAHTQGAKSLLVAGLPQEWQKPVMESVGRETPPDRIRFAVSGISDAAEAVEGSAVLWLGEPHAGARLAKVVHDAHPGSSFWMGPAGDNSVFTAHRTSAGPVFWATWVTPNYNADSQAVAPEMNLTSLTYAATCHALAEAFDKSDANPEPLELRAFVLAQDGRSAPIAGQ